MTLGTYVYPVNVLCPAGTAIATPTTTKPALGDVWLDSVELRIPVGHRGLTGVYVANNNTAIVPYSSPPTYLIGDDERLTFDIGDEVATQLSIVTYNTDVFDHTFYFRFSGRPMSVQNAAASTLAPVTVVPI